MPEEKRNWRRLQKVSFNKKRISKRAKKVEQATVRHAHKFIVGRWENIRSVRRHIIGWLVLVGVLIAGVGLQMTWFQRSYIAEASAPGGTYAEGVVGAINTLNPLYVSTPAEAAAKQLLFSSLLSYDTSGHLKGDLAESYTVDTTGKIYTVKLKPGITWHDGAPLDANDVLFTINLIKEPTVRSSLRVNWSDVKARTLDDLTLEFTLPGVYAAFPHALTFGVLPQHVLRDVSPSLIRENAYSLSPIGSGPFQIRSIQTTDVSTNKKIVHMAANKRYFKGAPKLERFQLHTYATHDAVASALKFGEINAAADLTASDVPNIDATHFVVDTMAVDSGVYALFNTKNPILSDKLVRQALQIGTDTDAVRAKLPVTTKALDLPIVTNTSAAVALPKAPDYNVDQAKALLDKAGWTMQGATRQKAGQPLRLSVVTIKGSDYEAVLQQLSGQWRSLGIQVDTQIIDPSDSSQNFVQSVLQRRSFDVLIYELAVGGDPDVYAYWHSSQATEKGYNFSNYSNSVVDDNLVSARTRLEPELRAAKYAAFAKQWLEDAPAIGLYQSNSYYAHTKAASPYDQSQVLVSSYDRYANVIYWTVERTSVYKTP